MNRSFYLLVVLLIFAAGCSETGFKRSKSGMEYRIISGNGGKELKYGSAVQFRVQGYYRDSTMVTPYDSVPQLFDMDSTKLPPEYFAIFKQAKAGDSIITRKLVDSVLKEGGQLPPYAKKGNFIGFRFKILDVIEDKVLAETMKNNAMRSLMRVDSLAAVNQKIKDDKILTDLIAKDKINAVKAAKGTYVEIKTPGDGTQVDSGKVVTINYKGMTLDGKIFDQSYDPSGKPTKPFTFVIGQGGSIEGWDDGLRLFKKGGQGRLFIPSGLGYGARGSAPAILPNQCLVFEIEVADVQTEADYRKKMEEQNKMQQQNQLQQPPQQK